MANPDVLAVGACRADLAGDPGVGVVDSPPVRLWGKPELPMAALIPHDFGMPRGLLVSPSVSNYNVK